MRYFIRSRLLALLRLFYCIDAATIFRAYADPRKDAVRECALRRRARLLPERAVIDAFCFLRLLRAKSARAAKTCLRAR